MKRFSIIDGRNSLSRLRERAGVREKLLVRQSKLALTLTLSHGERGAPAAQKAGDFVKPAGGFTVLELLVTLAIIGVVVTAAPNFWTWVRSYGYKNSYHQLQDSLGSLRNEALSKNTTSRLVVAQSGDTYTMTSYVSSTPVSTCGTGGTWTQLASENLKMPTAFQMTGAAMTNLCFYRDGSSSGGTYTIAQKDGGTDIGFATVTVLVATGFVNVQAN